MNTLLGYSYNKGGEVSKKLKPIPKDNPGLKKLPQEVRNRMGYMQEGGSVTSALARLRRNIARYDAQQAYEEAMRDEASKRKRSSIFGGVGSLLGSLLLPAITGATGGLGLALTAGLGSYLGKKTGAASGYEGKLASPFTGADYTDYSDVMDEKDLIYGSDAFRLLEGSARDYARGGIDQDAIVSGLKSSLMAGFGGDDSMYARAGKRTLFSPSEKLPELLKVNDPATTDFILNAEQGMYGELAPFKTSFGLNQQPINPMASGMSRVTPSMVSFNPVSNQSYNLLDFINS